VRAWHQRGDSTAGRTLLRFFLVVAGVGGMQPAVHIRSGTVSTIVVWASPDDFVSGGIEAMLSAVLLQDSLPVCARPRAVCLINERIEKVVD